MQIQVVRVLPNDQSPDFPYMEVIVTFHDEVTSPHRNAEVRVYIEKSDLPLPEIKKQAIQKAKEFLKQLQ